MDDIINLIKDKSGVLKFLLDTMIKSDNVNKGLRSYIGNDSISDQKKMDALLEVTANQTVQIKKLASILLIYSQSSSFDSDAAKMAMKFGKGEEALQTMFQSKFGGKG